MSLWGRLGVILADYNLLTPLVSPDELTVDQPFAVLKAPKVWGALHGEESLLNLILIALCMPLHTILSPFIPHYSL